MPTPATSPSPSVPEKASATEQWPSEAADFVVRTVGTVRDKTTGPAITAARVVVFGAFASLVGLIALVLFAIASVRVLTVYIPGNKVWYADLIIGGVFTLVGLGLWTRTRPRR